MAESNYQRKLKQEAERMGWTVIKLVRATVNGYPDLVLLHPTWGIMFIEVKDVKGKLSKLQEYRIQELNTKGFAAIVADPSTHAETIGAITPQKMTQEKKVLDVTAGSRMMWFDKSDTRAIFTDRRTEKHVLSDGRSLEITPDIEADFTNLPFTDDSFYLVVFDPPHLKNLGENSWLAKKYGKLFVGWEDQIREGLNECLRVCKPNGTVIFKWNENQIKVNRILEIIDHKPLFGHPSGKHGQTIWMTFIK